MIGRCLVVLCGLQAAAGFVLPVNAAATAPRRVDLAMQQGRLRPGAQDREPMRPHFSSTESEGSSSCPTELLQMAERVFGSTQGDWVHEKVMLFGSVGDLTDSREGPRL